MYPNPNPPPQLPRNGSEDELRTHRTPIVKFIWTQLTLWKWWVHAHPLTRPFTLLRCLAAGRKMCKLDEPASPLGKSKAGKEPTQCEAKCRSKPKRKRQIEVVFIFVPKTSASRPAGTATSTSRPTGSKSKLKLSGNTMVPCIWLRVWSHHQQCEPSENSVCIHFLETHIGNNKTKSITKPIEGVAREKYLNQSQTFCNSGITCGKIEQLGRRGRLNESKSL